MFINSIKFRKLLLTIGLCLVFFNGLIRVPEVHDHLFPEDLFETRSSLSMKLCRSIEINLALFRGTLDNLAWLEKQKSQDIVINNFLTDPPSVFSQILGELFPENFWKSKISLAKKRYVDLTRETKFLHALVESMDSILNNKISGDQNLSNQTKFDDRLIYLELLKKKIAGYDHEIAVLFQKLISLENTAMPFKK